MNANAKFTISKFMTPTAFTIGESCTCEEAHSLMRAHRIRHLPVVRAGRPVGLLSLHGLHFSLANHHEPRRTPVSDAMEPVVVIPGSTPIELAAHRMIEEKVGAILVQDGGTLGIFTTIDALYVVIRVLDQANRSPRASIAAPG